ncbi:ABC transporter permease, partial [Streptococcus sobrinus]
MKTKKKSLLSQMSPYLKGYRALFGLAVVFSIISSTITVIGPDKLKEMTDTMTKGLAGNIDLDKIGSIAMTLALLYIGGALVSYAASFIVSTLIQRFSQRLRNAIADKINKVPLKYFDSHAQGDTLSRVTNDVDLMTQSFNQSLVTMVASIVLLIGSIFMMIKTNGLLAATAIGSVFAGFLLTGLIMARSQPLFKKQQKNLADVSGYVEEIYSGHNVVTSYNARRESKEAFEKLNQDLFSSMWKSQ